MVIGCCNPCYVAPTIPNQLENHPLLMIIRNHSQEMLAHMKLVVSDSRLLQLA